MSDLNLVVLSGRLGRDPESRATNDGRAVCNVSLATSDKWKDKGNGSQQELTQWHNLVFFDRLAEVAQQYLRKGAQINVHGKLVYRKWTDKEEKQRSTPEIRVEFMQMVDTSPRGSTSSADGGLLREQQRQGRSRTGGSAAQPPPDHNESGGGGDDDDIPF
jgi:single-strand DNA-binding protein